MLDGKSSYVPAYTRQELLLALILSIKVLLLFVGNLGVLTPLLDLWHTLLCSARVPTCSQYVQGCLYVKHRRIEEKPASARIVELEVC